jgi:hypothetical protein
VLEVYDAGAAIPKMAAIVAGFGDPKATATVTLLKLEEWEDQETGERWWWWKIERGEGWIRQETGLQSVPAPPPAAPKPMTWSNRIEAVPPSPDALERAHDRIQFEIDRMRSDVGRAADVRGRREADAEPDTFYDPGADE